MEQSVWEANSVRSHQEIPHYLWNPKVHTHVHNNLPVDNALRQINPLNIITICFFNISKYNFRLRYF
jgi:hypothetical protein